MAQDPEDDEEQRDEEEQQDEEAVDLSHDLDMVTLYESSTADAEIEVEVIHGILETNGVPSFVVSGFACPNLGYQVQVPRSRIDEARRLIDEAEAAGPEAAAEAEAATETGSQ
jgi:hypothetical protein